MKKWVGNLVLLSVMLGLTFGMAELAVRLFVPQLKFTNTTSKLIGWSSPEVVKFNPYAQEWSACKKRVLFLGDSYLAAGPGEDRRFPTLFAQRHPGLCAAILATGGWGTDQELIALAAKGMAWKPDLVVLAFTAINDAANNYSAENGSKSYFFFDESGELRNSFLPTRPVEEVLQDVPALASDTYDSQAWRLLIVNWRKMLTGLRAAAPALEKAILPNGRIAFGPGGALARDPKYDLFCGTSVSAQSESKNLTVCDDVLFLAQPKGRSFWDPRDTVSHLSAYLNDGNPYSETAWRLTEALLGQMKRVVAGQGAKLAVLLHPDTLIPGDLRFVTGAEFEQDYDAPGGPFHYRAREPADRLAAMTGRLSIPFLNPNPALIARIAREGSERQVWPNPKDPHYSPLGHEMMAEALEKALPPLLDGANGGK